MEGDGAGSPHPEERCPRDNMERGPPVEPEAVMTPTCGGEGSLEALGTWTLEEEQSQSMRSKNYQQYLMLTMESLTKEEVELKVTLEELKRLMSRVSKEVREKEEEARKLTKKVERLREVSRDQPIRLRGEEHGRGPRRTAVSIVPEEIWKVIHDQLSDPKDLWNCCNTCQLFEDLLRPWKTGWMLEQALPYLYRHLPGSKLLECRLVSKGWYSGVNSFLDNHPSTQPHSGVEDGDPRKLEIVYPVKQKELGNRNFFSFGPEEDLSRLEELFPKTLGRNPFIGRYVGLYLRRFDTLEEDELEVEKARWAKMSNFLESYGKEIWNLSVYLPQNAGPGIQERARELLSLKLFQLAPNLRKLYITDTDYRPNIDPASLPPAPHFETLQADLIEEGDEVVQAMLERYHMQLRGLHLLERKWESVCQLEWPSLTDLLLYMGAYNDDTWGTDFDSLITGSGNMPRLSKLSLWLNDICEMDFPKLVLALKEVSSRTRLSTLMLNGPFQAIAFRDIELQFHVFAPASLKTLELVDPWNSFSTSLPSHNFLRIFPLLENLAVFIRNAFLTSPLDSLEKKYETEVDLMADEECKRRALELNQEDEFVEVNKYAYNGQLYKSNIWELLPRLKVITFQWDVYTRQDYDAYLRSQLPA